MATKPIINVRLIIKFNGILIMMLAGFMLFSLPWSLYYDETMAIQAILLSAAITFAAGFTAVLLTRRHDHTNIGKKEGYLIVTLIYLCISFFGALPFYLSGYIPSFSDAFFEATSGIATTGATILVDIEALPKGLLFWRSMTHWLGGMGIIVLTLAILPILGVGGMQLFVAEVPGTTPTRLHPRITQTAKRLWGIYVGLTLVQTALLMLGGMDFFHSLNHAFSTVATGGFSTQNGSIGGYSAYIQYIVILFMILGATSFTLHYYVIKGQFEKVLNNEEFLFFLKVIAVFTLIFTGLLLLINQSGFEYTFRKSLFQVVSIITTTGFITTDYMEWNNFVWFLLFLLMFTGGCIGSTAGGLKMIRILVLIKNTRLEFKRLLHPMAVIPVRINRRTIPQDIIHNFLAFFLLYMLLFMAGSAIMTLFGLDFASAIGASAATLGNVGPAIATVGPIQSYAAIPDGAKWVLSAFMIIGRLEIFTVLLLFSPSFYKK
ncbi:MAG: TrkH family potassium uptake protein [Bacteroidales bacterium]|nr:TrkH family potassium uptake protein [Bacteroidales bacterium]